MPVIPPVLLSEPRVLAAYLIFFGSYFVFALGKFPWMKIDRRTLVTNLPDPHAGWLILAMASTLAGNLTITGSVANIIVVERAAAEGVPVGFRDYFRIGLPVTVASLVMGSIWLWTA
jgi:Na+/H+ antiporter NhaD/arsenite permease-like protein